MAEAESRTRLMNPWALHFQKLGLELKCPLCLNLLNKPMLLPCDHIFCNLCVPKQIKSECPACNHQYLNKDIRPAAFIENIITIYRGLDAAFKATVLPGLSSDTGKSLQQSPLSATSVDDKLRKRTYETSHGESDNPDARHNDCLAGGTGSIVKTCKSVELRNGQIKEFHKPLGSGMAMSCGGGDIPFQATLPEEIYTNQAPELSPGSSPSVEDVNVVDGHCTDPGSKNGDTERGPGKRVGEVSLPEETDCAILSEDTFLRRDAKRQKKLNYGLSDPIPSNHGCNQQTVSHIDNIAAPNQIQEPITGENIPNTHKAVKGLSEGKTSVCVFCQSSNITDGSGPMLYYMNGKLVDEDVATLAKAIPAHSKCIEWTPQVYYVGETIKNLDSELARAAKLKCSGCGVKGAALGCYVTSCRRSYHVPCAFEIPGCRWDCVDYLMLCPSHSTIKFPSERSSRKHGYEEKHPLRSQISMKQSNFCATSLDEPKKLIFCGSALSSEEKVLVVKFATSCGAIVSRSWNRNVTHVIAATDAKGACSRTLKVLMGILNGRWIVTVDWIKACMQANCIVNEEPYEVNLDNHGCTDGPKNGRLRASANALKLFDGLKFHFVGDFVLAYKNDLLDLVEVGGGAIIDNMENMTAKGHDEQGTSSFVIYNRDSNPGSTSEEANSLLSQRLAHANHIAKGTSFRVVPHTWLLESIAACRVLPLPS